MHTTTVHSIHVYVFMYMCVCFILESAIPIDTVVVVVVGGH